MKSNKRRILVLAALPLTVVLAGGVALAATGSQPAPSPTGTLVTVQTYQRTTDRAHDPATGAGSSTAPTCSQDQARDRDRDRDRDGTCLLSPSAVPNTMMHHAYGNCVQSDDQSGDG